MQINYGQSQIEALLSKLRIFNKEIGNYEVFAITETFNYAVKLSNGRILIKIEDLQDDERGVLTPENLQQISNRFISNVSNEAQTNQPKSETNQTKNQTSHKKSKVGKYIFIGIAVILGLILLSLVLDQNNNSYTERVMTIEEIEPSKPTDFLSTDGTYRENFWGDKFKISCVIINRATVASYKDAVVRVTYYSKTKTVLGSNDHTIYEVFKPSSEKKVEFKADNYNNVHSIGWEVISAIPY